MKADLPSLHAAVPTLSEAIEVALPHLRALVSPLSTAAIEPDNLVEAFIESVLFGAAWFRPPYRPIDMAEAFLEDILRAHGTTEIVADISVGPGAKRRGVLLEFGEYADFVRRTFWDAPV